MWVVNETAYNSKPNGITVHFYRPSDWEYWDTRVFFYEDNNILMQWPGTLMNGNREDKWLTYTIYGINNPICFDTVSYRFQLFIFAITNL